MALSKALRAEIDVAIEKRAAEGIVKTQDPTKQRKYRITREVAYPVILEVIEKADQSGRLDGYKQSLVVAEFDRWEKNNIWEPEEDSTQQQMFNRDKYLHVGPGEYVKMPEADADDLFAMDEYLDINKERVDQQWARKKRFSRTARREIREKGIPVRRSVTSICRPKAVEPNHWTR